jgi:hypothetical protein
MGDAAGGYFAGAARDVVPPTTLLLFLPFGGREGGIVSGWR